MSDWNHNESVRCPWRKPRWFFGRLFPPLSCCYWDSTDETSVEGLADPRPEAVARVTYKGVSNCLATGETEHQRTPAGCFYETRVTWKDMSKLWKRNVKEDFPKQMKKGKTAAKTLAETSHRSDTFAIAGELESSKSNSRRSPGHEKKKRSEAPRRGEERRGEKRRRETKT